MGVSDRSRQIPLYFVNAPVDYALIGGVSILTFLLLAVVGTKVPIEFVWTTAAVLAWGVNWPHFAATSYRLYHVRSNVDQYPVTALVVPLLLTVAVVGSFLSPEGAAPWLVKLFIIWSPYHFSGQSVGITLIYARRAGFKIGKWERLAISGFIFSTFLVQTAATETGQGTNQFYSVTYPTIGLPLWVPSVLRVWMCVCAFAFVVFAIRWSIQNRKLLPPIVLLPALAQFVWFVPGWKVPAFNTFVPFFHALQYMLIAWFMHLGERHAEHRSQEAPRMAGRPLGFIFRESMRWAAVTLVGGIVLFWLLPKIGASVGFGLPFATAVILSAVQIHHFFVDGVIWKLKNPKVASPLLGNVKDLLVERDAGRTAQAA